MVSQDEARKYVRMWRVKRKGGFIRHTRVKKGHLQKEKWLHGGGGHFKQAELS